MAFSSAGSNINALYSWTENPPPVFDDDKRFNKDKHDAVYHYAMAHFHALAQDKDSDNFRKNCTRYTQFYLGTENVVKRYDELEIRQVNLLQMYCQLKYSKLLSDKLKIHYISNKNNSWEFAQSMNQLFDWHSKVIRRNRLQQRIELTAPLYGTVGALYTPKYRWMGGERILIPADWDFIDPRCMFFEPRWSRDEDLPSFAIRMVANGLAEDAEHYRVLRRRGLEKFERGSAMLSNYGEIIDGTINIPSTTHNFLAEINNRDVEVTRIWIKDLRKHKMDVYYPEYLDGAKNELDPDTITPDVEQAFDEADREFGAVLDGAHPPVLEENQWAHYVRHRMQVDELEKGDGQIEELQLANLGNHMDIHLKLQKKQPPDDVREDEYMFKGGWRFIKIIGKQVVADGSINFDYEQFPVALFHNIPNPESLLGISDIENLLALQDDFNNLLTMEIVNASANAYGTRIMPERLKDVERVKKGTITEIYVESFEEGQTIKNLDPPASSSGNRELAMMLQQLMQMVTGATSVVQGEIPRTRTSGAGIMALQQQATQRYTATQFSLNDGWERSATIWLAQIKQFWKDEIFLPPLSPEYRKATSILNSDIDPSAHLIVERVSQDINFQEQQGAQAMQVAMVFAQGGVPFQAIMELMATSYDGSTVSRISSQLKAIMEKPEYKQQMQMQEQAQMMQMMQGNNKSGK